jgi:glycosyltransferase involved in cell wall biosynthesis
MDRRGSTNQVRILLALAGLHKVDRGAEVAFINVGRELAKLGNDVTLMGSGPQRAGEPYRYVHVPAVARERFERWPKIPTLRNETSWEEASFAPGLLMKYRPADFDITATCAFPFTNWALRRPVLRGRRPKHVFITQNGDWPAHSDSAEFRYFGCDGLVCTNPDYFERNRERYRCSLIPNGVDLSRFHPGAGERARFGLPEDKPVVLMVSAFIASKKVAEGIRAVAAVPGAQLVVAGDGPLRDELHSLASEVLPGRFKQISVASDQMPALYRSAGAFMHLSVDESFGNVFVEAMASGLPIVAYDTKRTRWIIGDEAFFAPVGSADALPALITGALRRGPRPDERAQHFGWPSIGVRYRDFFADLIA